MDITVTPVTADLADAARLFGASRTTSHCWCMWFVTSVKAFHAAGADGNQAHFAALAAESSAPMGLLAHAASDPVGWCAAGPRSRYVRAIRTPSFGQRDPAEDDAVWLVPCLYVRPEHRRGGVARAWLAPGEDASPTVVVAAYPSTTVSIVPTTTYKCRSPCAEWEVLGLTGLLQFAAATSAGTFVGDQTIASAGFLKDGIPHGPFTCRSTNLESAPVIPALGADNELILLNLDPSCGVTMPGATVTSIDIGGWGVVIPTIDGARYSSAFRLHDVSTGEVTGAVGVGPPATGDGHTHTVVVGNPPTMIEAGGSVVHARTLADGRDRFVLELLPMFVDGPPCAGDLNGDGAPELVVPLRNLLWAAEFRAYDLDGELLWTDVSENATRGASCSVADLDGDGADEVLIVDEQSFRILDGRTGAILFRDDTLASVTVYDYPIVADLDGDGSSEILVGSAIHGPSGDVIRGERSGLFVFTHPQGTLNGHPPFWPGSYMHHTNVDAEGRLVSDPAPWWEDPKTDGHHRMVSDTPSCPDLAPSVIGTCTFSETDVQFEVAVENIGTLPVLGPVTVELRTGDDTLLSAEPVDPPGPGEPPVRVYLTATAQAFDAGTHVGIRFDDGPHAGCENPALQARW